MRPVSTKLVSSVQRRWPWFVIVVAASLSGYIVHRDSSAPPGAVGARAQTEGGAAGSGRAPHSSSAPVVPVAASAATKGDMAVYLTGLGTVTPVNTVTVRTRVDGQILRVGFREGQLVRQGDLLAEIDPRPFQVQLAQAEGQVAKDRAALKNANLDLRRYQVLVEQDSIPRQQLDTQAATVDQYEAALQSDQAQIDGARLNLAYSRITAPIAGRVGLRQVDPGNIVHASDPGGLVVITQLEPIDVVFTIPADALPEVLRPLRTGQRLDVDAFDREDRSRLAAGSLLAIDNEIDPSTGTVRLKAVFPNEDGALFPNQFVNARIHVETLRGTVIVPTAAIQRSPQSTFVYVVKGDGTVDLRNVEVRLTEGDETGVSGGLSPGDAVVVDGVDKLRPGARVTATVAGAQGSSKGAANP